MRPQLRAMHKCASVCISSAATRRRALLQACCHRLCRAGGLLQGADGHQAGSAPRHLSLSPQRKGASLISIARGGDGKIRGLVTGHALLGSNRLQRQWMRTHWRDQCSFQGSGACIQSSGHTCMLRAQVAVCFTCFRSLSCPCMCWVLPALLDDCGLKMRHSTCRSRTHFP